MLVMKASEDQWLDQFQLVKVTRRLEDDIKQHRQDMTNAYGEEADWDSALVDWTVITAHEQVDKELEILTV